MSEKKSKLKTRMLCEGACMVAVAQVLSFLKIFELPQGGSITLAMLPLFVFAVRWGLPEGLLAGFAFGILQLIFDGAYAFGWQSMIGDYLLAFAALGFAGVFHGRKGGIFLGTVVGSAARFLVHYVVGATIWADYMPDTFFGLTMTTPWFYSLLYNGSYMAISMALCLVVAAICYKPLEKYFNGRDLLEQKARG